jgi:hypothetical protein
MISIFSNFSENETALPPKGAEGAKQKKTPFPALLEGGCPPPHFRFLTFARNVSPMPMQTARPETTVAEMLGTLTFVIQECLAAWERSEKTARDRAWLKEARVCVQLQMKLMGIGVRVAKVRAAEAEAVAEPSEVPAAPLPAAEAPVPAAEAPASAPNTGAGSLYEKLKSLPLESQLRLARFLEKYPNFLSLAPQARLAALRQNSIPEREARLLGWIA